MTLNDIKPKESCIIIGLGKKSLLRKRIIDMGLTMRTRVKVVKLAPLGDPIEIEIRGYQLSLRKDEAEQIFVERVENA
jgi:ferrous iron transport protein A